MTICVCEFKLACGVVIRCLYKLVVILLVSIGSRVSILLSNQKVWDCGFKCLACACVSFCLWVWDHGHKIIQVLLLGLLSRLNEFQNGSKNGGVF